MRPPAPAIKYLLALELFGIKVGLRNIRRLLAHLGNPERRYPIIHIAGTNGKGSTAAMIAAVLTASGYRTALYTSPHLVTFRERIRVDGKKIDDEHLQHWTKKLRPVIERTGATFFEATTAIAFAYFASEEVDIAVVETGLGGRLDATNVVDPLVSVITNVAGDHEQYLGRTPASIAREKAGIIKPNRPCVVGTLKGKPLEVIKEIARSRNAELMCIHERDRVRIIRGALSGLALRPLQHGTVPRRLELELTGSHQLWNLECALRCIDVLKRDGRFPAIDRRAVAEGLASVRKLTGFRGRLDIIRENPLVLTDVAHNPEGAENLAAAVQELLPGQCITVFGVMKDKKYGPMLDSLRRFSREFIVVRPSTGRALEPAKALRFLHNQGISALDGGPPVRGYHIALDRLRVGEYVLITGSHHTVGEIMEYAGIST